MKKLITVLASLALAAALSVPAFGALAESGLSYGEELFRYPGMEGYFTAENEGDTAALTDPPTGQIGSGNWDSYGVMRYEDANYYLRLGYTVEKKAFCSFFTFVDFAASGAGDYVLSADVRAAGEVKNLGWRLSGANYSREFTISNDTDAPYADLADSTTLPGWKRYSVSLAIPQTEAVKLDSIQMWHDTQSDASNFLDIDNLSLKKVTDDRIPTVVGSGDVTYESGASAADLTISFDMKDASFAGVKWGEVELLDGTDYMFDAETSSLTLKKDFLLGLAEGENDFTLLSEGENGGETEQYLTRFSVNVVYPRPEIPDITNYIEEETLLGGTFEDKAENSYLAADADANGWGSNGLDNPAQFVTVDGSRVMKLSRDGRAKDWTSVYAMTNPIIEEDDILKLSFDYKLSVQDASQYRSATFSFVGASANSNMFDISLNDTFPEMCAKSNGQYQWEVEYETLENGWHRVSMLFVADRTFMIKTDSIRFLLPYPNGAPQTDALYLDNVSLKRYLAEKAETEEPIFTESSFVFDKGAPKDLSVEVDLRDYNINKIMVGDVAVEAKYFSYKGTGKTTLEISKEFLSTLKEGEHTFTVTTLGGSATFTVTVKAAAAKGCGCGTISLGSMLPLLLVGAGALAMLFVRRRRDTAGAR